MNNRSEMEALAGTPDPGPGGGGHDRRRRSDARRCLTIAVTSIVVLGAVADVGYAVTGDSSVSPRKPPAPVPMAGRPTGKVARYAAQVLTLANSERAQHRCATLTVNAKLARAAQGHSADMAAHRFFGHTDPDGKGPAERLAAAGYPQAAWGENIAAGQRTPAAVMNAWMKSPGHRANILNCGYRAIGIGIAFDGGVPYWTQDFGAAR